uniref:RNB domain-containing protein n=1 Tax=Paramoeba aestuarina TaxID=180227 RepID=A0A7S4PHY4_9EUKA|mmetsp:Transcript_599/g.1003  ORF Transcript_599/g.1003 Transcript_599/m.1003 type:complete len:419 (+) Transcript_599:175-1431(+)
MDLSRDPLAHIRRDLTQQVCFALDPFGTKIADDCVAHEIDEQGREWVFVHVADPARLFPLHHPMDEFVKKRGLYARRHELSHMMFPQDFLLYCNLQSTKENYVMTFAFRIGEEKGERKREESISEWRIFPSVVKNIHHLPLNASVSSLSELREREEEGKVELEVRETGWKRVLEGEEGRKLEGLMRVVGGLRMSDRDEMSKNEDKIGIIVDKLVVRLCGDVVHELLGKQYFSVHHLTVTSPLRRYTDLHLHHMIHEIFRQNPSQTFLSSSSSFSLSPSPRIWEENLQKTMIVNDIFRAYEKHTQLKALQNYIEQQEQQRLHQKQTNPQPPVFQALLPPSPTHPSPYLPPTQCTVFWGERERDGDGKERKIEKGGELRAVIVGDMGEERERGERRVEVKVCRLDTFANIFEVKILKSNG